MSRGAGRLELAGGAGRSVPARRTRQLSRRGPEIRHGTARHIEEGRLGAGGQSVLAQRAVQFSSVQSLSCVRLFVTP